MGIFCFLVWFYPVGLYRNAESTDAVNIRSFGILIIIVKTFLFASCFAFMLIARTPNEEVAGGIATIMSIMPYAFCGI
jgi:ATP-binding cassette subfamily G (WHITE) protein 2 (PDR)